MTASGLAGVVVSGAPDPVGRERRWDTVSFLTVYLLLLFAIPSDLRIPALGGAGAPSSLWALAGGLWWCWFHLQRTRGLLPRGHTFPVRTAALCFLAAVMISYVFATMRPLSVTELNQADIGVLRVLSGLSLLLLAADTIPTLERLRAFVHRFAWLGAALAVLGLAQFLTGRSLVDGISIPGLTSAQDFSGVSDRGGFVRAAGTAMSPLEYAAALSAAMPMALMYALYATERKFLVRWSPAAIIGVAMLLSGSRSALLGLVVGVVVLFPTWSARIRAWLVVFGGVALVAMFFLVPGMVGTIRYLFTETSTDPSALSRSNSYEIVAEFVSVSPLFGRGFGTFLPQYRILDNGYLLLLVETGAVGLAAMIVVVLTGAITAVQAGRTWPDGINRKLGPTLAASLLSVAVLVGFFDALSFPMSIGCLFLTAGLCGACWRLTRASVPSSAARIPSPARSGPK